MLRKIMQENFRKIYLPFLAVMMLAVLLSACSQGIEQPVDQQNSENNAQGNVNLELGTYHEGIEFDPDAKVNSLQFGSEQELNDFIDSYASGSSYYEYRGGGIAVDMVMEDNLESIKVASTQSAPAGLDYSETNVQVEGIDEADIIKTDGDYIYTVTGSNLYIIKAYPGEDAEIVHTMLFDDAPSGIFVQGDIMAVFGNFYDLDYYKEMEISTRQGMTYFNIYDISDKEDPELEKEFKFEGNYFDARMKDEFVYFVVKSMPESRPVPMPIIIDGGLKRTVALEDVRYYNIPYDNAQFATVHAIDLDSFHNTDSKTVAVEYSQDLYMSHENIFITYTERISEWELRQEILKELVHPLLSDEDKELIEKIKKTDNDVLSQSEKEQKIMQVYNTYMNYLDSDERDDLEEEAEELLIKKLEEFDHFEFTIINKLSIDEGDIDIEGNGKVPGSIINQFAMDEDDGYFRIATTLNSRWSSFGKERTESSNNVYVLDEGMDVVGKLEGLAETERIYSTRFMGDRLYMVTFRQVDPFFVIDLSDPENPEELGKLKIPGFSRYLHPYDDNIIIGLGRDASAIGRTQGLKISLFDVSDVKNPEEIAKFITDEKYASSTAEYEHKAFLFSKEKELLVIPAYSYSWENGERKGYNGAFVFHITRDEIELRGLIDHSMAQDNAYYYGSSVERSLYIEDMLYTKSPNLLRINALDDLGSVKNIELEQKTTDIPIY